MQPLKEKYIAIGAEMPRSAANGPGIRYVVWLQGCALRCPGCFNPEFQPFCRDRLASVEALASRILSTDGIEGVTYTGGEPLMQDEPLSLLSAVLKERGLGIVCYTGFTLEELRLRASPHTRSLLGLIDILIDGRFERERRANLLWRGSANQRVHFLTDRYACYRGAVDKSLCEMEIAMGGQRPVLTGMLRDDIVSRLERALSEEA